MKRKYWSADEIELLRQRYADTPTSELAAALGRPASRVLSKAHALGLHKSAELISAAARARTGPDHASVAYRWVKGSQPWNTGIKGSAGIHPNSRAYQFRPGHKPHTWVPVGSLRIKGALVEIKYADDKGPPGRRWKFLGRHLWEQAHGPVPPGHLVVFKPGRTSTDPKAITLDAVELITRREIMVRNSMHTNLPPEVRNTVQLRGALNRIINRMAKEAKESKAP